MMEDMRARASARLPPAPSSAPPPPPALAATAPLVANNLLGDIQADGVQVVSVISPPAAPRCAPPGQVVAQAKEKTVEGSGVGGVTNRGGWGRSNICFGV